MLRIRDVCLCIIVPSPDEHAPVHAVIYVTYHKQVPGMTTMESFLSTKPSNIDGAVHDLKLHILNDGIPINTDGSSALRCTIWSILLCIESMETDVYLDLVYRGPSPAYQKIRNDTFRTLASDPVFKSRVSESSLIRILNAHTWMESDRLLASHSQNGLADRQEPTYVQGMNILAAPFLYACNSEVEAFAFYNAWITREIPLYVKSSLEGVHSGVALIDQCLQKLDTKLYNFLKSKNLNAELYAFPCEYIGTVLQCRTLTFIAVLTLSACTPPLSEVLTLWDFFIAYGPHMNILCVIAQLILMREQIMSSTSPMSLLRKFPALKGARIKQLAISFIPGLGDVLYDKLARHCWDESLSRELGTAKKNEHSFDTL